MEFPIYEPLVDLVKDDLDYTARFPEESWDAGYFAQIALREFAREDWHKIQLEGPPNGQTADSRNKIFAEIDQLGGPDLDQRRDPKRSQEIFDQISGIVDYFVQFLMLSPSQRNTLRVMEMADQAGLMAAMHFKNEHNRGRPQQVSPALVPLIPPPGHPSWPSGHSLESHLIALALRDIVPAPKRAALEALAERIAKNREIAGVHFKSDSDGGRDIAQKIFPYLQKCPTFHAAWEAAKGEH